MFRDSTTLYRTFRNWGLVPEGYDPQADAGIVVVVQFAMSIAGRFSQGRSL